jgi:hypothetical protein
MGRRDGREVHSNVVRTPYCALAHLTAERGERNHGSHANSELQRLRDLQGSGGGSDSIADQIAALEREYATSRQIEVKLIEEELVMNKAVASINRQPLTN